MADSSEEPSTSARGRGRADISSTYTTDPENNRNNRRRQHYGRRNPRHEETREQRMARMQAVVNNTPFKTGWEVKDKRAEKKDDEERVWLVDVVAPQEEEFFNDEYIHTLSPEEQKLHNWKKTQRGIDTRFKCISMEAAARTRRVDGPPKKLRTPGATNDLATGQFQKKTVSYLIPLRDPVPIYSDEPLPDTGHRGKLDLRCIRDERYLKGFNGDIEGFAGRRLLSLGPSCSRYVEEYCKSEKHAEVFDPVTCHSKSWKSDPNSRIDISYPDGLNYSNEEEQLRKSIIQPLLDEMRFQFLTLRQENCNYVCSLHDGLQPTIHLISKDKYTRILCITPLKINEVRNGLVMRYTSFIGLRKLRTQEIAMCVARAAEWKLKSESLHDGDNAYEVVLGESGEGENFYEAYGCNPRGMNYFSSIVKWPVELDDDYNDRYLSLVAKWYPFASTQKGQIWVKNPEDIGYAEQILNGCSLHVQIAEKFKEGGSRLLLSDWYRQADNYSHDPIVLERLARKILELNDIELDKVVLARYKQPAPLSDENIKAKLNWRMGRSAVNHHIWIGHQPKNEAEWYLYNRANEERLDWTVEVGATKELDALTTERKAVVKFKKQRFGRGVIDYTLPQQPDWQFFTLSSPLHRDRQGVRFFPVFTVRFVLPKSIRTVCHKSLEQLDTKYRDISSYDFSRDSWWVRLRDYKYDDVLVVEGWPPERVEMVADEAAEILEARVVDCKDDESEKSPAKLLYGCGLAFVNYVQRQHNSDVVLSVDRLNEKIQIWGDKTISKAVSKVLANYPKNRSQYRVQAEISISEPRFLPIFKEVLEFNGEQAVSKAVGGAMISFRHPDRLVFKGNVEQYEALQEMLDVEHSRLITLTKKRFTLQEDVDIASLLPKTCPVCLMPARGCVSLEYCGHSYCLTCLTKMIRVAIKEKKVPIKCCAADCEKLVALRDITALLFDETSRELPTAFKDRLEPLWKATHEIAVMQSQELTFCPKADCRSVINRSEEKRNSNNTYTCNGCGSDLCAGCFNPPHTEWSCEEEMNMRGNVDLSLQGYMASGSRRHDVKKCPNIACKAMIEKDFGCNHMHCRVCNIHFCWLCMFMAKTPAGIYKHMTEEHGGTGGEWAFLDEPQANMANINLGAPPGLENRVHQMVRDMDRNLRVRRGELVMIDGHPVFVD